MSTNFLNNTVNSIFHSCTENQCIGAKLNGLHVKCSKCGSKIFLECLQNRSETSELLKTYGIITSTFDAEQDNVTKIQRSFNIIFDHNSPFAIHCAFCKLSTEPSMRDTMKRMEATITAKQLKVERLEGEVQYLKSQQSSTESVNNNNMTTESEKIIESFGNRIIDAVKVIITNGIQTPHNRNTCHIDENSTIQTKQTTKDNANATKKISPVNGVFSIHVSHLPKETTTDGVAAIIIGKSDIHTSSFNVEKLPNKRYRGKPRNFSSFKISTLSSEVCDKIIESNDWDPNWVIKPFVVRAVAEKEMNTSKTVNSSPPKQHKGLTEHNQTSQREFTGKSNRRLIGNARNEARHDTHYNINTRRNQFSHTNNWRRMNRRRDDNYQAYSRNSATWWQQQPLQQHDHNSQHCNVHRDQNQRNVWQNDSRFNQQNQFQSAPFWQQPYFYPPYMIPMQQQQQQIQPTTHIHPHTQSQPFFRYQHQ